MEPSAFPGRGLGKKRRLDDPPATRGILLEELGAEAFSLRLFPAAEGLRDWIEYYWCVAWDLGEREYVQTVVTNPTVDLSFEDDEGTNGPGWAVLATGVVPAAYDRRLRGRGFVFAAHFLPAMFRPWWGAPVASLRGRAAALLPDAPWRKEALALPGRLGGGPPEAWAAAVDELFLPHRPPRDEAAEELRDLVRASRRDRSLWSTEAFADRRALSVRSNQRQFLDYVGASPGWVARRHRVQGVIEALDACRRGEARDGACADLTALALDFGYFDLAHLSREFRALTGRTLRDYRAPPRAAEGRGPASGAGSIA